MNCIVTAGPTFEPLDDVRRLTNFSTGRLGTELANFLTSRGHKVTLLVGELATYLGELRAQSVKNLFHHGGFADEAEILLRQKGRCHLSRGSSEAILPLVKCVHTRRGWKKMKLFKPTRKISTRDGNLFVELVPTPKIIGELRGWFPQAKIVGWKFEADGNRADALRHARQQIADCATDFCVANGPAYGRGFNLVSKDAQHHFASMEKLFAET